VHIIYGEHHFLSTIHETGFPLNQLHWRVGGNTCCECKVCESVSTRVQWDSGRDYTVADTHNEKHRHMLYANPCEDRRGDILHYPEAVLPDGPPDSFSYEAILGRGKTMTHQRPFLHADKQTCRHEVEQRQNSQRFCVSGGEAIQAPLFQVVPTCDIGIRIVENELHRWTTNQHHPPLRVGGLFFEYPLNLRIRPGNHRPWFSQTKFKMPEKSLALSHTKINMKLTTNEGGQ